MGGASELTLAYSDNGVGFSPSKVTELGMGLSNISSRINSLGGELNIASSEGRGMSAFIKLTFGEEPSPKNKKTFTSWQS